MQYLDFPMCQSLSSIRMLAVFTEDPEASLLSSCHSDESLCDCPKSNGWMDLCVFRDVCRLWTVFS